MFGLPRNVWILTISLSLLLAVSSLVVFVGGLVGAHLAPSESLATLPVASIVVGTAVTIPPVTLLMKILGRRKSFFIITVFSILVALFTSYAVYVGSFNLFCLGSFLFGATYSCVMQFRFAAMECVPEDQLPKAASLVLFGGIVAAFLGPEIAVWGKDLLAVEYAGSFIYLAVLFSLGFFFLLGFRNPEVKISTRDGEQRSLRTIIRQPIFWVAMLNATISYAVMSFIMTATPVSMHIMEGHSLEHTKWVIQSHIIAMFLPSLMTGWIIKKIGIARMMIAGVFINLICIAIAFAGRDFTHYWFSLVLLGIGWNFLFIGATTLLPQSYRQHERFKVQALNDFVIFGVQAVVSLSAGWFIYAVGWNSLLVITLPFVFLQFALIYRWAAGERRIKKASMIAEKVPVEN